jgi:hypothetical protein
MLLAPGSQLSKHSQCKDVMCIIAIVYCRTLPGISSLLICQNEFIDKLPSSLVSNKSTVSRLVNRFRDTGNLHWFASYTMTAVNVRITEAGGHFQEDIKLFLDSDFNVIYF